MPQVDPAILNQVWLHSWEEDTATETVYRPAEFRFPPSRRPRIGFQLSPNGELVELKPGRADKPEQAKGTWEATGHGIRLQGGTERLPRTLKLLSSSVERLVFEK